jgi:hypothetical protein
MSGEDVLEDILGEPDAVTANEQLIEESPSKRARAEVEEESASSEPTLTSQIVGDKSRLEIEKQRNPNESRRDGQESRADNRLNRDGRDGRGGRDVRTGRDSDGGHGNGRGGNRDSIREINREVRGSGGREASRDELRRPDRRNPGPGSSAMKMGERAPPPVIEEPSPSCSIRIDGFIRPFTLKQAKEMVEALGGGPLLEVNLLDSSPLSFFL